MSDILHWLSQRPLPFVTKHNGYDINGFHFVRQDRDSSRVTQNNKVSVVAFEICDITYYRVMDEICVLDYHLLKVLVLKCDWVQNSCVMKDELEFILIDLNKLGYKSDLFISTSQAKEVFYGNDQLQTKWSIVCNMPTRSNPNKINEDEVNTVTKYPPFTRELPTNDLL